MNELKALVTKLTSTADGMRQMTIQDAARHYKVMRDFQDEVKELTSRLQSSIDSSKHEVLPSMFRDNGVTSISVDGYRFTVASSVRASIPGETKPLAYQWLRDNDLGELIIETVNSSTLAAQARKMMEDGTELDDKLFRVAIVPTVSITKV
jgi:hypothetical protein